MKRFLKILAVLIFAVPLAGMVHGAKAAQSDTVKVGIASEPYPPFSELDAAGHWTGWEIQIMHAVCKAADLHCVIVPLAWSGIIPALQAGKIDMIFNSMSITPAREKEISFSNKYYGMPPLVIIGPKSEAFKPTADGLKGKILGVQVSTISETYARKHFPNVQMKVYQTQDEVNQDLVDGRIDGDLVNAVMAQEFLKTAQGKTCCVSEGDVAPDPAVLGKGVGAGIRKNDATLRNKINVAIAKIRADGVYQKISRKYFDFDIYGS
ncbi:MAG TPA: transporter substrate-binding domain-containing protein [Acidiphilium sp.]